jgi:hypothetical protein
LKPALVSGNDLQGAKERVTGGRRKLHDEKLHNLYPSLNITRMILKRKIRQIKNGSEMISVGF